jgi:membrane protease YdiL (CAAX protease family)
LRLQRLTRSAILAALAMAHSTSGTPSSGSPNKASLALLLLLPVPSLGTAAAMFWWPELVVGKLVFVTSKLWLVALPVAWRLWADCEPLSWSPARKGGFGIGAALGLAISIVIIVAYAIAQKLGAIDASLVAERAAKTGLNTLSIYLIGALYWITLNSVLEEYVWRWFVFRKCEVLFGGKAGVIVAALGFTAHHVVALAAQFNWPITIIASLGVFIGGATWNWLYLHYRSIWPGYLSHAIVDVAIFILGYRLIFGGG